MVRTLERNILRPSPRVALSREQVYQRMGWTTAGKQYHRRRVRHLRFNEVCLMARALGVKVGDFCSRVWIETIVEDARLRREKAAAEKQDGEPMNEATA